MDRSIDSYCPACQDVRVHVVAADPGACACTACGAVQQLVVPLG